MLQPTSSAAEIAGQLASVPPFAMFLSQDLLPLGQEAAQQSSVSAELPLYRLSVPGPSPQKAAAESGQDLASIPNLDDLIEIYKDLPPMHKTSLSAGEATRRVAYYCTTSGTSGFQVTP